MKGSVLRSCVAVKRFLVSCAGWRKHHAKKRCPIVRQLQSGLLNQVFNSDGRRQCSISNLSFRLLNGGAQLWVAGEAFHGTFRATYRASSQDSGPCAVWQKAQQHGVWHGDL